MVANAMSLTNNGLRDWIIQRLTAVVIAVFTLYILMFLLFSHHVNFMSWQHLFRHTTMRIFTGLTILSLAAHAWIGVWTILTDYIKPASLRFLLECLVLLALSSGLIWGFIILWEV